PESKRSASLFPQSQREAQGALGGDESAGTGRFDRQAAPFSLRTGPEERRLAENQALERAGNRHRWLHTAPRNSTFLWRDPGWVLRGRGFDLRRKSGNWIQLQAAPIPLCAISATSEQKVPIQ